MRQNGVRPGRTRYATGGRAKMRGGGMSTARRDMSQDIILQTWVWLVELCIKKVEKSVRKNKATKLEKMNPSL
jgi:hypothetical protein